MKRNIGVGCALFSLGFFLLMPILFLSSWQDKLVCSVFFSEEFICDYSSERVACFLLFWSVLLIVFYKKIIQIFVITFLLNSVYYNLYMYYYLPDTYCLIDPPSFIIRFSSVVCFGSVKDEPYHDKK
jgi:hypothetical protein